MSKKNKIIRRIIVTFLLAIGALYLKGYRLNADAILKEYHRLYPGAQIIDTVTVEGNQTLYVHELKQKNETMYTVLPIKQNLILYHTSDVVEYPSRVKDLGVIQMGYFDNSYYHNITYIDPKYQVYQQYLEYQFTGSGETLEGVPVKPIDIKEELIEPIKTGYYFDLSQYQRIVIKEGDKVVSVGNGWFESNGSIADSEINVVNLKTGDSHPILDEKSNRIINQFNDANFVLEGFKITPDMEAIIEIQQIQTGMLITQIVYTNGDAYLVREQTESYEFVPEDESYTETVESTNVEIREVHQFLVEEVLKMIGSD